MRIATHSGPFHTDDVFAVAILAMIYDNLEIARTRDPAVYSEMDMRVDIGNRYDHGTRDYDHHQKEGAGVRENEIPYAAAGLVWKHYGHDLVGSDEAWEKIENKVIMPIDALDNGIELFEDPKVWPYTLQSVIKLFNPTWQDDDDDFDARFAEAVDFAKFVLEREIAKAQSRENAKGIVREAIQKMEGKILVLDRFVPWKKTAIEESDAVYAVYESYDESWRCHAVPTEEGSFEARKDIPEEWGGLEHEELQDVTGVGDAMFCHRKLFLCGAKSKEGAMALAKKALER